MHRIGSWSWRLVILSMLTFMVIGMGCSSSTGNQAAPTSPNPPAPQARPGDLTIDKRLVAATNDFGFRAYAHLVKKDAAKNLFISPTSIELALAMTYNGAKAGTKEAMAKSLGLQGMTLDEVNAANAQLLALLQNPDAKVELSIADSLWGRQGITFDQGFLERNAKFYQADIRSADFAAPTSADTINAWVKDKTRGKITKLVDSDSIRDALMLLVNALYFKGQWTTQFDPKVTQDGPFTLGDGAKRTLPMMSRHAKDFRYLETEQFQAIELPYGDQYVSMFLFLPREGATLADFIKDLNRTAWDQWMTQFSKREGTITLPRFSAEYSTSLKPALAALGMGVAFTGDADLSGMLPLGVTTVMGGKPFISDVLHKTALQVNEEGTTAAAVTGVIVGVTSVMPNPPFNMKVDHPFFLAIRDNPTGAILFMGSIVDPQELK